MPSTAPQNWASADPAALPVLNGAIPLAEPPRRVFVAQIMGLPMSVHIRGPKAGGAEVAQAVEIAFDALRADDATFSTWKPDSPVSRIRRGELSLWGAGDRVLEVATLCLRAAERTDGSFSAWRPGPDGRLSFDPSGLVKGWAVQQVFDGLVERLARLGRYDLLFSAGGDIIVGCARTDTPDWTIGIEDPRDRSQIRLSVPLRRGAVATSGTAARGPHIIDPVTGVPARDLLSATVIGPSLLWADVYATAAFVRGRQAATWATTLSDHAVVLIDRNGSVETVSN